MSDQGTQGRWPESEPVKPVESSGDNKPSAVESAKRKGPVVAIVGIIIYLASMAGCDTEKIEATVDIQSIVEVVIAEVEKHNAQKNAETDAKLSELEGKISEAIAGSGKSEETANGLAVESNDKGEVEFGFAEDDDSESTEKSKEKPKEKSFWKNLLGRLGKILSGSASVVKDKAEGTVAIATGVVRSASGVASGTVKSATGIAVGAAKSATDLASGTVNSATELTSVTVKKATDITSSTVKSSADLAGEAMGDVTDLTDNTVKSTADLLKETE